MDAFRAAMAGLPAPVVVVAARGSDGLRGLTASSFTSVSLEPPLVLVCLDRDSRTRDAIAETGLCTVSVLERGQEFVAKRFAGRAPQVGSEWSDVPHELGPAGLPILRGCVAWFDCALRELVRAGDHDIAVAEVTAAGRGPGEPLVLWDRSYWRLG
jgi:flavin reductase (DIM6/NTAB) family NADH-FMN oxidoreductase RutF